MGNLLWFEFQGHKGQKGRYDRQKLQIAIQQHYESKFGVPTLLIVNMNTPHPIQDRITENNSFKAHKVSQKDENCIPTKNGIEYIQCNILLPLFYISTIF